MILRILFSLLVIAALAGGQTPAASATQIAPSIGVIDFYGLSKVTEDRLRGVLGFRAGDPFPRSKADVEEHIDTVPGIVESHLEAVCCDAGKMVLYVGIEERGAPHFDIREAPEGEVVLPPFIVALYRDLLAAVESAAQRGSAAEDLTRGHALAADPLTREIQQKFPDIARDHIRELRDVLRNSMDDEQRAVAAYVIAYTPRKTDIADDLQYALRDADPAVRANAARGMTALAVFARLHPDDGIKIEPTWFIEMLHSLSWSDRDHALRMLLLLTDSRDALVLDPLRDRALNSLAEMARWKTLEHALPAFILAGRIAGSSDTEIQDAWTRGDRDSILTKATARKRPGK
jgi:hypothetical protein